VTDFDKALQHLHEKIPLTLRRHELQTLAILADAEADRYQKRAARKNAAPYTVSANIKTAGSYRRIAQEIRNQITDRSNSTAETRRCKTCKTSPMRSAKPPKRSKIPRTRSPPEHPRQQRKHCRRVPNRVKIRQFEADQKFAKSIKTSRIMRPRLYACVSRRRGD
jgi:hypothetical protein